MRLFLASQDFGDYVEKLHKLVGDNTKTLVIFNARDYVDGNERKKVVERKKTLFESNGFEFTELDLRNYFSRSKLLKEYISEFNPGLIFTIGGNYFVLRRALHESGLDAILSKDLREDKYVYGGASAGAMVATPDLRYYDRSKNEYGGMASDVVPNGYKDKVIWNGLNLVDEYILPHYDRCNFDDFTTARIKRFKETEKTYITLSDSSVYVVNGAEKEILK